MIETSGSVGAHRFQLIREFIANVTTEIIRRSPSSGVGVILFSSRAHIEFNLTAHANLNSLLSAIYELPYDGGFSNTAGALTLLLRTVQNGELGLRNHSLNNAIVITDGSSSNPSATISAANALHASYKFDVYAVGIENAVMAELQEIANSPEFVYFTRFFNSDGLSQLADELLSHLCNGEQ